MICGELKKKRNSGQMTMDIGIGFVINAACRTGLILGLSGVKKSKDLWVEMNEGDDLLIKPDDTPYFVDEGDRFYTVSQKINQG